MTGPGDSPRLSHGAVQTLLSALEQLAAHQGLSVAQAAVRCVLTGHTPTRPTYSREVIIAYQVLEGDQVRGTPSWAIEDALNGQR